MTEVAVVMTMAFNDGAVEVPLNGLFICTLGVADVLKKPGGYINVMKLPMASGRPVEVKLNVANTLIL
jgi:hypothetical protein